MYTYEAEKQEMGAPKNFNRYDIDFFKKLEISCENQTFKFLQLKLENKPEACS